METSPRVWRRTAGWARRHFLTGASLAWLGCLLPAVAATPETGAETQWALKKLTAGKNDVALPRNPKLSITFTPTGTVSGYSGVNHFSARYRRAGNTLEWTSAFRSTRKGGPKELTELETKFMKVLQHCTSHEESGTQALTLAGSEGTMGFERVSTR